MKSRMAVKVTFKPGDPFDTEIINVLEHEKNKAGFIRKAVFCFIRGLETKNGPVVLKPREDSEQETAINKKISKLTEI